MFLGGKCRSLGAKQIGLRTVNRAHVRRVGLWPPNRWQVTPNYRQCNEQLSSPSLRAYLKDKKHQGRVCICPTKITVQQYGMSVKLEVRTRRGLIDPPSTYKRTVPGFPFLSVLNNRLGLGLGVGVGISARVRVKVQVNIRVRVKVKVNTRVRVRVSWGGAVLLKAKSYGAVRCRKTAP